MTAQPENISLDKTVVMSRITEQLSDTPWTPISMLKWSTKEYEGALSYGYYLTELGEVLICSTSKGICYIGHTAGNRSTALDELERRFPENLLNLSETPAQMAAARLLGGYTGQEVILHLKATPYQFEIWRRVLTIPAGQVVSYQTLANGSAYARAAGTANSKNPIFYLIPCHRVVRSDGTFDRYFWGNEMKRKLLEKEFITWPV